MSNTDRVDLINIAMMLLSCAIAFVIPFELFLFAYAVLGPLHYLTEISWLHDRGYFISDSNRGSTRRMLVAWLLLVALAMAIMLYGMIAERILHQPTETAREIGLVWLVFAGAALAVARDSWLAMIAALVALPFAIAAFFGSPIYAFLAFFLLTLIHVLIFTGMFLLHGALRSRGRFGLIAFAVWLACIALFFIVTPEGSAASGFARQNYGPFTTLNAQLIRLFGFGNAASFDEVYASAGGIIVMRLIAFAYTYHYLNWFTKTSVINWHHIPRSRAMAIILLWLASLAVYAWNYAIGFILLYTLSALHVLLELPLNHRTLGGIWSELVNRLRPTGPTPALATSQGSRKRKARSRR